MAAGCVAFVHGFSDDTLMAMLGPNPTQERFRLAAYYVTDLAFQASGYEPLTWNEFVARYRAMYPSDQRGLPDDPMTAYVDALRGSYIVPGGAHTRQALLASPSDHSRECFLCDVRSTSSSTDGDEAPRQRATDAQPLRENLK
jgi:hypothetical protein